MLRLALPLLLLLLPGPAAAERVGLRTGLHQGHARIVFDWPRETGYQVEENEGRVTLRFARPAEFDLAAAARGLRNLRGIAASGPESVTLTLAEGARLRHFRLGNRVVLDLLDPPAAATAAAPPAAAAAPAEAAPPAARRQPAPPRAAPPAASGPPPSPAAPASAPAAAAPPAPAPPAAAAPPAPPPASTRPAAPAAPAATPPAAAPDRHAIRGLAGGLLIPAPAETGAALFGRAGLWMLVLDAPLPLRLGEGAPAGAEIATGPAATVLRLPAAAAAAPGLTRLPEGWRLDLAEAAEPGAIRAELDPGPPARLLLRAARPASAVAVLDPETGGTLLVGTVLEGGEATRQGRRTATFDLLPTRLGMALLPRADSVTLRALAQGFAAAPGPGAALALGSGIGEPEGEALTRLFDLPDEPLPALAQRERNAMLAVGAAPPLARGRPRLAAAEALLALGLGAEAQAMAALAMREDPRLAEEPRAQALHAAAALLAGRLHETGGLAHPRLPPSDEARLWRALLAAARGEETAATAAAIAATLPILRSWPQPLRDRLAPLAAEALAAHEPAAARRLLAGREQEPAFALARARLHETAGETEAALAAYDALRQGRDRRARAIAMRRAADLRLASGALDAAGAAMAMEAVLAAWRGDALEAAARLRLAELRQQAGQPRAAFELLRETETLFPDLAATLRPRQQAALLAALEAEPPIAAVALFDTHHALLPAGEAAERALATLAERLAALDLPDRARQVLARALAGAGTAQARAALGLRLAHLALGAEDPAGARAALAETAAPDLPPALREARLVAEARALARLGAAAEAAARYREAGPGHGAELAEFLAARQDWAGAAAALLAHLEGALPPAGAALDEAQRRLVARAAALLALAGDEAGLAALRDREGPRMQGGAFEEAFALLTSARLGGAEELPRARRELDLARNLTARLEPLRTAAGSAR